jgi:hypothetical protein
MLFHYRSALAVFLTVRILVDVWSSLVLEVSFGCIPLDRLAY